MSTPLQRKHAVIKELSQVNPKFYNYYSKLITNYNSSDNNISNILSTLRNNFNSSPLIDTLSSHILSNNLPFEILYQKLIDQTFTEDKFVLFSQF